MQIQDYFMQGNIKGAIDYMRTHEEFREVLPAYIGLFEKEQYRSYGLAELPEKILLAYQVYLRSVFYCAQPEPEAAAQLLAQLSSLLDTHDEDRLPDKLQAVFEGNGLHALFGKTQGFYGPYIWRDTVSTVYTVELPGGTAEYTVNILKGFVFRSWMDYLTFGSFGTSGWASPDGTINCIEQATDFDSEGFRISLLKHEAQHTQDMKRYPGITVTELEYRAKLVELCYSTSPALLQKFLAQADERRPGDSHAMASARLSKELAGIDPADIPAVQAAARILLRRHDREMDEKCGK